LLKISILFNVCWWEIFYAFSWSLFFSHEPLFGVFPGFRKTSPNNGISGHRLSWGPWESPFSSTLWPPPSVDPMVFPMVPPLFVDPVAAPPVLTPWFSLWCPPFSSTLWPPPSVDPMVPPLFVDPVAAPPVLTPWCPPRG
jgi:hypothetical protein